MSSRSAYLTSSEPGPLDAFVAHALNLLALEISRFLRDTIHISRLARISPKCPKKCFEYWYICIYIQDYRLRIKHELGRRVKTWFYPSATHPQPINTSFGGPGNASCTPWSPNSSSAAFAHSASSFLHGLVLGFIHVARLCTGIPKTFMLVSVPSVCDVYIYIYNTYIVTRYILFVRRNLYKHEGSGNEVAPDRWCCNWDALVLFPVMHSTAMH